MSNTKNYLTIGNVYSEAVSLYTGSLTAFWLPYIAVSVPLQLLLEYMRVHMTPVFLFSMLFQILSYLVSAAVGLYVLVSAESRYRDSALSRGEILDRAGKIFLPYILLQLLVYLGLIGGILLLIVPGIIFSLWWSVSSPVFVIEGAGITESMRRSKVLTKGYKGEIFIIYALFILLTVALYFLYSIMAAVFSGVNPGFMKSLESLSSDPLGLKNILYSALFSFLSPLYPLMQITIYYNLKKEKEGYVTEELAESFLDGKKEV